MAGIVLAGTGHRPHKLRHLDAKKLSYLAEDTIKMECRTFSNAVGISGMALGWDTIWAEALIELDVPLIAAVPFEGQEALWPLPDRKRYERILKIAEVIVISKKPRDPPHYWWARAFQDRNEWMVNHCTKLVALWDGSDGGTKNCVRYAQKLNRPILNLWEMAND